MSTPMLFTVEEQRLLRDAVRVAINLNLNEGSAEYYQHLLARFDQVLAPHDAITASWRNNLQDYDWESS